MGFMGAPFVPPKLIFLGLTRQLPGRPRASLGDSSDATFNGFRDLSASAVAAEVIVVRGI